MSLSASFVLDGFDYPGDDAKLSDCYASDYGTLYTNDFPFYPGYYSPCEFAGGVMCEGKYAYYPVRCK